MPLAPAPSLAVVVVVVDACANLKINTFLIKASTTENASGEFCASINEVRRIWREREEKKASQADAKFSLAAWDTWKSVWGQLVTYARQQQAAW